MPQAGFIYVFSNRAFPRLLKIGSTHRHPLERARELSTTSLPAPFVVEGYEEVSDRLRAEKEIHRKLSRFRESPDREFFRVGLVEVLDVMASVAASYTIRTSLANRCPACNGSVRCPPAEHPGDIWDGRMIGGRFWKIECPHCGVGLTHYTNMPDAYEPNQWRIADSE